jgi:ferritin-like metal-binding protein YciE
MNRTGVQMSPIDTQRMLERDALTENVVDEENLDGMDAESIRSDYIADAEPVGTVPMPGTLKGAVKTGVRKVLAGKNPEVFVDKLGERLAFERTGTRLYDALILKFETAAIEEIDSDGASSNVSLERLRHFREEEAEHFELLADCLEQLGADPTAQTPCADVAGVESMGLMQVLNDPRTTLPQCLNAILVAELADNAGWELLIKLADELGQKDMVKQFKEALKQEQEHLDAIKTWNEESVLAAGS